MSTIEEQLKALREETLASLKQITAENEKEMQELRVSVLGKKGSLTEILKGMKDVSVSYTHLNAYLFWIPLTTLILVSLSLFVVGQNLADASDPRTHR